MRSRRTAVSVAAAAIAAGAISLPSYAGHAAAPSLDDRARAFAALPDWTGVWMGSGTLFEQRGNSRTPNGDPNARDYPPYKPEWESAYDKFLNDVVKPGKFADPLTIGYPGGIMRMFSPARGLQFVVRPEQVWIIYERPDVRYIYTDGRPFPPADELWPTFEGYSVGHWEGDTLVVETRSIKGGVPIDRTGAALSDSARVTERIRKVDTKTLEDQITVEDPVAFTKPWKVTRRYTKRPEKYPRMENVSSLENNRNPVVNGQTTIVLSDQLDNSNSPYTPDIRPLAVPNFPRQ